MALNIVLEHLKKIMPQMALDKLSEKFKAGQYIDGHVSKELASWQNSVPAIPNGKALILAPISEKIWRGVSEALLNKKQLKITYRNPVVGGEVN